MFSDEVKKLIEMHFTLYILSDRYISRGMELVGNVVEYFRSLSYVVSQTVAARLTLASWHFVLQARKLNFWPLKSKSK